LVSMASGAALILVIAHLAENVAAIARRAGS
jgi:hypothetical protein